VCFPPPEETKGITGTMMSANPVNQQDAWKLTAYVRALRGTAIDTPAKGGVTHGEDVFGNKRQCGTRHLIRGKGGLIGPDLSNIAGVRKYSSIVDALTKYSIRWQPKGHP
jgi:hypothetical protein